MEWLGGVRTFTIPSRMPKDMKWVWGSMNPGNTVLPPQSMTPCGPAGALPHLVVAAHVQDPAALEGHGLGRRVRVVHRDHGAVDEDRIRVETLRQRHPYPSFLPGP